MAEGLGQTGGDGQHVTHGGAPRGMLDAHSPGSSEFVRTMLPSLQRVSIQRMAKRSADGAERLRGGTRSTPDQIQSILFAPSCPVFRESRFAASCVHRAYLSGTVR